MVRGRRNSLGVWGLEKKRIESFVVPFVGDTIMGLIVVIMSFGVSWILQNLQVFGLGKAEAEMFERVHLWINYSVFMVLGVDFLARLVRSVWRDFYDE